MSGERGRNRTYNLVIKSHLLCQLSYAPVPFVGWKSRREPVRRRIDYSISRGDVTRPSRNRLRFFAWAPGGQSGGGDLGDIEQLGRRLGRYSAEGVAEHGLAERACGADHACACSDELLGAFDVDALAGFLPEEHLAAARAAAERALPRALRLDDFRIPARNLARLIVHIAVAAEIARVVIRHAAAVTRRLRQPRLHAREQLAVMFNGERRSGFLPVGSDGADAMRANRDHPGGLGRLQRFDVLFGHLREREVVAEAARGVAGAALLAQHAEGDAGVTQHARERKHNLAALRIVCPHAAEPEAVFLRAVVKRQLVLLDEFLALGGGEAESVPVALQIEEQLGAVVVLPLPGVDRAAPQADDHGQVLDADRALVFAASAGGALERGLLGNMRSEQRRLARRAVLLEVAAQAENDLLRIEDLARIERGAVLGAASAFHAREGLERVDAGDVLARHEPEILVARERRDAAEAIALEEYGERAEGEMQVLGVRDQRKKDQQRQSVQPPRRAASGGALAEPEAR